MLGPDIGSGLHQGPPSDEMIAQLDRLPHAVLVSLLQVGMEQSVEIKALVLRALCGGELPQVDVFYPTEPARSIVSADSLSSDVGRQQQQPSAADKQQYQQQQYDQLRSLVRHGAGQEQRNQAQAASAMLLAASPVRVSRQSSPQQARLQSPTSAALQQAQADFMSADFRMYSYKVAPCCNYLNHSWNTCPYAYPGENVRRRDPRRFCYVAVACPYHKAAACMLGEGCPYAHGVFEVNLHPAKYRTEVCRDGNSCSRAVCFFAHSARELRVPSLECAPTPKEFAASEGLRVHRVKASLPLGHVVQGMIDSALQDALAQLRMPGVAVGAAVGMDSLANGQVLLLNGGGNGAQRMPQQQHSHHGHGNVVALGMPQQRAAHQQGDQHDMWAPLQDSAFGNHSLQH